MDLPLPDLAIEPKGPTYLLLLRSRIDHGVITADRGGITPAGRLSPAGLKAGDICLVGEGELRLLDLNLCGCVAADP